jgi:hypothetical protein
MVNEEAMFACPCCGFLTLGEQPPGTFEICPVCNWEDDGMQAANPGFEGGANEVSLDRAKHSFAQIGAISQSALPRVRKPLPEEIPKSSL